MNGYLLLVLQLAGILVVCTVLAFVLGRRSAKTKNPNPVVASDRLADSPRTPVGSSINGDTGAGKRELADNDFSFVPEPTSIQTPAQPQPVGNPAALSAEPGPVAAAETGGDLPELTETVVQPGVLVEPDEVDASVPSTPVLGNQPETSSQVVSEEVEPTAAVALNYGEPSSTEGEATAEEEPASESAATTTDQPASANDEVRAEDDLERGSLIDEAAERIKELEKKVRQQEIEMARLETGATTAWDTTMPKMLNRIDELESELGKALKESQELHNLLEIERGKASTSGWPTESPDQ